MNTTMEEANARKTIPKFDPYGVCDAEQLTEMIGDGAVEALRAAGLRAIGDRYLGAIILETFRTEHDIRSRKRLATNQEKVGEKHNGAEIEKNGKLSSAIGQQK